MYQFVSIAGYGQFLQKSKFQFHTDFYPIISCYQTYIRHGWKDIEISFYLRPRSFKSDEY